LEVTATKVAVSLARAVAKVDRYPYQKVASKEDNPWSNGVTVTGGGWATSPSDDIPPF
jgi:hypothetical protein